MNLLLKLWNQPNWVKWIVYFVIAYILFAIKEAFAIVLWFLFCILLYYVIFAKNMFQSTTYYEKKILSQWCSSVGLEFDSSMLQWKKGNHPQDGIWWKHWYDNVIATTHFQKFSSNEDQLDQKYQSIYDEALDYYNKLYYFAEQ